jgi:hypothetical protein
MYFNDRTAAHDSAVHVGDLLYLYLHAFLYFFIFCLNARTSYFKFAFVQLIYAYTEKNLNHACCAYSG